MSWDAVILRIRGPLRPARQVLQADYLPLGAAEAVAAALRVAFPSARWSNPTYAYDSLDKYTGITFEFDGVEKHHSIGVRVSGSCDPIPRLLAMAEVNGWVVLDMQNGDFIDPAKPSREGWHGYRSLVEGIGRGESAEG
jgi:hypothetical protein